MRVFRAICLLSFPGSSHREWRSRLVGSPRACAISEGFRAFIVHLDLQVVLPTPVKGVALATL